MGRLTDDADHFDNDFIINRHRFFVSTKIVRNWGGGGETRREDNRRKKDPQ